MQSNTDNAHKNFEVMAPVTEMRAASAQTVISIVNRQDPAGGEIIKKILVGDLNPRHQIRRHLSRSFQAARAPFIHHNFDPFDIEVDQQVAGCLFCHDRVRIPAAIPCRSSFQACESPTSS
jgi:hypothetical protein